MKQIRFSAIIVPALILIAGIAYLGWWLFPKFQQTTESPYKAIPPDAALIIRINNPANVIDDLEHSNVLWKELSNLPGVLAFRDKVHLLDSLVKKNDELLQISRKNPLLMTMVQTDKTSFGFLFLIAFPESSPEEKITRFIEDRFGDNAKILVSKYGSGSLVRITLKDKKDAFYFAVRKGVFIGSFTPGVIKKAIDQFYLNIPSILNTGFSRAEVVTGKKADANIYICYPMLYPFLVKQLQEEWFAEAYKSASFADWTGLDLILKKDELLVNGYTTVTDSARQYAGIFAGQLPQKISVPAILPENTASFIFTGLSDVERYYRNFQAFATQKTGFLDQFPVFEAIQRAWKINLAEHLVPWIGNEICMATVVPDMDEPDENCYAVFKVRDPYLADSLLKSLRKQTGSHNAVLLLKKQPVYNLGIPNLIPAVFGKKYSRITGSFYTFIAEYVVFANDIHTMEYFIEAYNSKKTLDRTREYSQLREHISDNANVFCFFNTKKNIPKLKSILNDDLSRELESGIDSLRKFESASIQLSNNGNGLLTTFFVHFNPASGTEGPLKWQLALDTTVTGKPQILDAARNGTNLVLATDQLNNLYASDAAGAIRWKTKLPGAPMGPVQTIIPAGQDSVMFLVNTREQLCLLTCKGTFAEKYPLKFKGEAVAGMTVLSPKKREYEVLIPFADKKIHVFHIPGSIENILDPGLPEVISKPVQFLQAGKKDYLFITEKNGQVAITDMNGRQTIRPDKQQRFSQNALFYLNLTNKKSSFIADDPSGKVIYLPEAGKPTGAKFNIFTPDHLFLYEDINKDGSWEFIYFDKNKLYYYNRFFKLLYSYVFTREITVPPYLITLPDGTRFIGVVSGPSGGIYLFGKEGIIETEAGIRGNTAFDVGNLTGDGYWDLVIGAGKTLKNYRLPKE